MTGRATGSCRGHASGVRGIRYGGHTQRRARGSGSVGVEMKLKQRMVVLCAVLLLLGLAKIFLLDGGEGSAASRRDLRAFRKASEQFCFQLYSKYKYSKTELSLRRLESFWLLVYSLYCIITVLQPPTLHRWKPDFLCRGELASPTPSSHHGR